MQLNDIFTINNSVLFRLIVYSALFIFSFFIFVGVAVLKNEYDGRCTLFLSNKISPVSLCNYPMVVAIICQLLYSLLRLLYMVFFKIGKLPTLLTTYFYRTEFVCLCIDAVSFILIFIAAIILSAGFNTTCSNHNYNVCLDTRWAHAARVAQAGAWISAVLWMWLIIMVAVTLWRAGLMPWMKDTPSTTSSQSPPTQQVPQVSTLSMDTYQPTSPGVTVKIHSENPYEPDF